MESLVEIKPPKERLGGWSGPDCADDDDDDDTDNDDSASASGVNRFLLVVMERASLDFVFFVFFVVGFLAIG